MFANSNKEEETRSPLSLAAPDACHIFCHSAANVSVPIFIIFAPRRHDNKEESGLPLSLSSSPAAPNVTITHVISMADAPQMNVCLFFTRTLLSPAAPDAHRIF